MGRNRRVLRAKVDEAERLRQMYVDAARRARERDPRDRRIDVYDAFAGEWTETRARLEFELEAASRRSNAGR